jgi:hypothetical protein
MNGRDVAWPGVWRDLVTVASKLTEFRRKYSSK